MKSKIYFFGIILLIFFHNSIYSQESKSPWKIVIDEKSNKPMLIGYCTRENFTKDTSFSWWFFAEYNLYEPEDSIMKLINLDSIKIVIVLGTWCSDSRREVPHFYKILDLLKYDQKNLTVYCVDRKKQAEGYDINQFIIERVPTFIFYKNDSELGRIIEVPTETLERDILKIINTKDE
ncbi:MAG: thioredoxin family protein [Ignavibacteria bacterium]|nr:thioredoxin family protein [Ignavibacteria bacterium]